MKILVIEALGLHLGYLGCYGNDWVATPNLDRLAAEGVVFDSHFADQPDLDGTVPWHERSVGTGRYSRPGQPIIKTELAQSPRIISARRLDDFADQALAQMTDDAWCWLDGPSLLPPWTLEEELLDAYFDEDDAEEGLTFWRDPPLECRALSDASILRLQNTYAAAVTFFDAQLGKLLEHVPNIEEALICVTARAGLPLGEHGMVGAPRPQLHDELVHVPLMMRLPSKAEAGLRLTALTQPVDLLPTFLKFLGREPPLKHGHDLWPLIRGMVDSVRPYAVSMTRTGGEETWLMRTGDRALHVPTALDAPRLLFVKPDDRWEVNNLYQHELESADAMAQALTKFAEAIQSPGEFAYPSIDSR